MPAAVLAVLVGVLGLAVGLLINRAAGRFPWPPSKRSWRPGRNTPDDDGPFRPGRHDRGGAVRFPLLEVGTAALFALVALRFGASAQLPAFLYLAAAAVLLAVIDLRHRLLPDRVVLPSLLIGAVLLAGAALATGEWSRLARAVPAAAVLFLVYLALALIAPSGMGMGDVKLAALLGLYLGWLGWGAVAWGAAAGFVVQAVLALLLLAVGRVGLRSELPFGPAMLLGAALVIGMTGAIATPLG